MQFANAGALPLVSESIQHLAQTERLGIPRNVIAKACKAGRLVRITHGAYRMAGVPASQLDDLAALWKLTDPAKMTHERLQIDAWDGIAIAGSTAASILGIGDFHLLSYRILAPKRINSRNAEARFGARKVFRNDVSFIEGMPVTGIERTLVDLVLDREEPSLAEDAFDDARTKGLDMAKLERVAAKTKASAKERKAMAQLFGQET